MNAILKVLRCLTGRGPVAAGRSRRTVSIRWESRPEEAVAVIRLRGRSAEAWGRPRLAAALASEAEALFAGRSPARPALPQAAAG
jgi:hypothetical protein